MAIKNWLWKKAQQLGKQNQGAALVVTLMIVMVLVLLALSLTLQSQTEYAISINEQDAMTALAYAESVIDWLNNVVVDYATLPVSAPADLDGLLIGPDDIQGTADDNLPDLGWTCCGQTVTLARTLNTGITDLDQLNETNEQTTSGLISVDWDGPAGSEPAVSYQFFRMGINTTGGSDWDGPRAEVYVRIEDNYDSGTTLLDQDDTDFRMIGRIIVDYPVFVTDDGTRIDEGRASRGMARRKLVARFAPAGNVAIRTDGDLEVNGSLEVCGACGSVHGNQELTVAGDTRICGQATGTEGITATHNDPTLVRGGAGIQGEIFIPRINPYDDRWVPPTDLFTTTDDNTIPTYLQCPAPDNTTGWDPIIDPGASKYFAIVLRRETGHVWQLYKAYRDNTNARWVWRLIDSDLSDGTSVLMDNCGRITAGTPTPDPMPIPSHAYWGGLGKPSWAGVSVTNGSGFYGFEPGGGNRGNFQAATCTSDDSLATVFMNDFSGPYNRVTAADPFFTAGDTAIDGPADYTTFTAATSADPLLPGTYGLDWDSTASNPNPVRDGQRDFRYEDALTTGNGGGSRNEINKNDNVYSPLYRSVIFIYGNFEMNGTGTFGYVNDGGANVSGDLTATAGYWPVSFVVFNAIRMTGNPIYGPPGAEFPVTFVAGRDIEMRGTGNAHNQGSQSTCPSGMTDVSTDRTADPPNPNGREGMVLAHEEVTFAGNVSFDGFIVAEDAATCTSLQTDDTNATGSVQVHYDCNNPPNLWGDRSVRIVGWEEVQ